MVKVEAALVRINVGTSLVNVVAQDMAQSRLEDMRAGVVALSCRTLLGVYLCGNGLAGSESAAYHLTVGDERTVGELLCIGYFDNIVAGNHGTAVAYLTAHLCIERSFLENYGNVVALLAKLGNLAVLYDGKQPGLLLKLSVAHERGLISVECGVLRIVPAAAEFLVGAGGGFLLLHVLLEALLVCLQALFVEDLLGEVEGEAVGVVQLEYISAVEGLFTGLLQLLDHLVENIGALVDGLCEALFFGLDNLLDVSALLVQLRISGEVLVDNGVAYIVQERLCAAEKSAVSCGSSEQSAEDVASALVGGKNAVAHHECGASDVVGDYAQGNVLYRIRLVVNADN